MTDREPGVFYVIWYYKIKDEYPLSQHNKICVAYYRDYGETLEATFCHDLTKDYEYEEVICSNTTHLEANVNQNSIQLQWVYSIENEFIRGYHVYRDNQRITKELLTSNVFLDENLPVGIYEYYVRTYFNEGCVSDSSNHVKVEVGLGVESITNYELRCIRIQRQESSKFKVQGSKFKILKFLIFTAEEYLNPLLQSYTLTILRSYRKVSISLKYILKVEVLLRKLLNSNCLF